MKKFVHTLHAVNVAMIERVTEVEEDRCLLTTVIIRLTVKQNWASPSTTIFTNLFVIDVAPEDIGIETASLYGDKDAVIALQNLVGRSFQGYYENGQITVLVDTSDYVAVDLDKFEKVASFNLASHSGDETEVCRFDKHSHPEPIDAV